MLSREGIDTFAAIVHAILLLVIPSVNPGGHWGSGAGISLIMMQLVAIAAHIFYVWKLKQNDGAWGNQRNLWKWVEYAISATLGTLGIFLSANKNPDGSLLGLLITLSITIQTVGYALDITGRKKNNNLLTSPEFVQWLSAAVGQGADFGVVGNAVYTREGWSEAVQNAHFIPYVLGWSLFGAWNLIVLYRYTPNDSNDRRVEFVYSALSILAKACVFSTSGYYLK